MLCVAGGAVAGAQPSQDTLLPVTRLRASTTAFAPFAGIEDSIRVVIRDSTDWRALWNRMHRSFVPRPPLPAIDFQRDMVVVAALGRRPSTGYDIVIEDVEQTPTGLEVSVRRARPAPGCPVGAAVTQPVDLVRVPASPGPVRFQEHEVVVPCGVH